MNKNDNGERQKKEYLESYHQYNRILRSWFVAFGIGGPVIFLTNDRLYEDFLSLSGKVFIINLFLLGLSIQIFIVFVNKLANWYKYSHTEGCCYNIANWLIGQFWIDILCDVSTMLVFGLGIYCLITGLFGL